MHIVTMHSLYINRLNAEITEAMETLRGNERRDTLRRLRHERDGLKDERAYVVDAVTRGDTRIVDAPDEWLEVLAEGNDWRHKGRAHWNKKGYKFLGEFFNE